MEQKRESRNGPNIWTTDLFIKDKDNSVEKGQYFHQNGVRKVGHSCTHKKIDFFHYFTQI